MAKNEWADVRLTCSIHPNRFAGPSSLCVDWRLTAKAPGDAWTERSTVAMGSEPVSAVDWPISRDDALSIMTEVLMGVRWTEPPF